MEVQRRSHHQLMIISSHLELLFPYNNIAIDIHYYPDDIKETGYRCLLLRRTIAQRDRSSGHHHHS